MPVDPKPYKLNLDEFIASATSTPAELHPFFDAFRTLYNKKCVQEFVPWPRDSMPIPLFQAMAPIDPQAVCVPRRSNFVLVPG